MTNVVTLSISLPVNGSREDFFHAIARAHSAAMAMQQHDTALALAGLLTMADESTAFAKGGVPHFFFPPWGRTA